MFHCTSSYHIPSDLKRMLVCTFTVHVVRGLALGAAFLLNLFHFLSLIVVKLQQHVDELISSLLHQ